MGRLWNESWELEEHDVQLPRPLSATESIEVWSGVSSSVEVEEVNVEPRGKYPRASGKELLWMERQNHSAVIFTVCVMLCVWSKAKPLASNDHQTHQDEAQRHADHPTCFRTNFDQTQTSPEKLLKTCSDVFLFFFHVELVEFIYY